MSIYIAAFPPPPLLLYVNLNPRHYIWLDAILDITMWIVLPLNSYATKEITLSCVGIHEYTHPSKLRLISSNNTSKTSPWTREMEVNISNSIMLPP